MVCVVCAQPRPGEPRASHHRASHSVPVPLCQLLRADACFLPTQSMRRIDKFLQLPQMLPVTRNAAAQGEEYAVEVGPSDFAWEPKEAPVLKDIEIQVPRGAFWVCVVPGCGAFAALHCLTASPLSLLLPRQAIVGPVGSGKSSMYVLHVHCVRPVATGSLFVVAAVFALGTQVVRGFR